MQSYTFSSFATGFFSFDIVFSRFVHVIEYINTSFIFMAKYYPIKYIHNILFIHLPFDGHLVYIRYLAIKNNFVINIYLQVFAGCMLSFWGVYRSRIAVSHRNLYVEELMLCFPKWLYYFTIPIAMFQISSLPTSSPMICVLYYRRPGEYEVVSHGGVDLRFLNDQ